MSVLITGGSGSFSQAFVKRCLDNNLYDRICIYSRGEAKQAQMRECLNDDPRLRFLIGDIRDKERLYLAMDNVDAVIHAAALKRIEAAYYNPSEVVKTNVIGTMNVIETSAERGVSKVVTLSTDKAWRPRSIYGETKALAESLTLNSNNVYGEWGPSFSVVRYGNILGSTGSVIPKWREALEGGREILVTDLECTRFSMHQSEAVDLVLQALELSPTDAPLLPDPPAYKIADLLSAMGICDYRVTGLPEFEKLHEGLADGMTSDKARRMTVEEIKEALKNV